MDRPHRGTLQVLRDDPEGAAVGVPKASDERSWFFTAVEMALQRSGVVGKVKAIRRVCPPPFDRATWTVVLEDGREYELKRNRDDSLSVLVPEEAVHA